MSATKRNIILGWIALLSAYLFSAIFSNGYIFLAGPLIWFVVVAGIDIIKAIRDPSRSFSDE